MTSRLTKRPYALLALFGCAAVRIGTSGALVVVPSVQERFDLFFYHSLAEICTIVFAYILAMTFYEPKEK